jgi:hypothetical protein
VLYKF